MASFVETITPFESKMAVKVWSDTSRGVAMSLFAIAIVIVRNVERANMVRMGKKKAC